MALDKRCLLCSRRPIAKSGDAAKFGRCRVCHASVARDVAERKARESAQRKNASLLAGPWLSPDIKRVLVWKGHAIACVRGEWRKLGLIDDVVVKALSESTPERVVNLGLWQPGWERSWVQDFKSAFKALYPELR